MKRRAPRAILAIVLGASVSSSPAISRAHEEGGGDVEARLHRLEENAFDFLRDVDISGYIESSYTWSDADGPDDVVVGRSFDRKDGEFMFNALQLAFTKPVETDKWDAGFGAKLLFGQNASVIQSAGLSLGDQGDLQEGYIWLNAPIGNGVQFRAGKWVTLMGLEVIEDIANPTWSEGNQFLFAENFTGTGLEVAYRWNDLIDTQVRVFNGWDVVEDNNDSASFMGRLGITPREGTVISIVPYGGPEQAGNDSAWRKGVNALVAHELSDRLTLFAQGDYGYEDRNAALAKPTEDAEWWALGLWALCDLTDRIGFGFRADYFDDKDGARTSGAFPLNAGNRLWSLTATLNSRHWKNVLIRPEVRYDHSSVDNAFGDGNEQVTLGMSVAYILP